jgi:hypothetical protein
VRPDVIHHFCHPHLASAVGATEKGFPGLDSMAGNLASAVRANRRELVDGTLETVKHMLRTGGYDFK